MHALVPYGGHGRALVPMGRGVMVMPLAKNQALSTMVKPCAQAEAPAFDDSQMLKAWWSIHNASGGGATEVKIDYLLRTHDLLYTFATKMAKHAAFAGVRFELRYASSHSYGDDSGGYDTYELFACWGKTSGWMPRRQISTNRISRHYRTASWMIGVPTAWGLFLLMLGHYFG